jgi:DNA-binding NarL/FixJ family response regulator
LFSDRHPVILPFTSPSAVLAQFLEHSPCIVIVDRRFVDEVKIQEFYTCTQFGSSIRVLVEVEDSDLIRAEGLIRMGCYGCLSVSATIPEARAAVRAVQAGELWASRKLISTVVRSILSEARNGLTTREQEVVTLVSGGLKNQEIAKRLYISEETVRWHLRAVYRKLGTHDRMRLMSHPSDHQYIARRRYPWKVVIS